jgi:phospholipase C
MSSTNYNWPGEYPRFAADLNGDGRADIVGFGADGVWSSLSDGTGYPEAKFALVGFEANSGWRTANHPRFVADLTGDGRADILGFGDDGVWVGLGNGDGSFQQARFVLNELGFNQGWSVDYPRFLADLTGDGRPDIVGFGMDGIWVALGNGDGTFQPAALVSGDLAYNSGWRVGTHARFVADLTGDGRADILGFGNDGIWICLGHGDGTFEPAKFVLAELGSNQGWNADYPRFLADVTGDGVLDVVGFGMDGVWVALGIGEGRFQAAALVSGDLAANTGWRVGNHPRFVVDVNGDGRADLVGIGDDGVWLCLSNGDGTFQPAHYMLANFGANSGWRGDDYPRALADVTGDGRPDIVGFGDDGVWVATNNGDGSFQDGRFVLADFGRHSNRDLVVRNEVVPHVLGPHDHRAWTQIKHIFVLMMENRSYDHMLGFADLTGNDAATGQPTTADGLKGTEFNTFAGEKYVVTRGSPDVTVGPGHDFLPVLEQLCGHAAEFPDGGPYPEINNTGYVSDLVNGDRGEPAEIMRCFDPDHLPILTQLAREFAVCDRWFSSMPGPTEPNRYLSHAATCGTFDDSPSPLDIVNASANPFGGFDMGEHIFEAFDEADVETQIYGGDEYPVAGEMEGVHNSYHVEDFDEFEDDLQDPDFDAAFIHIEPRYFDGLLEAANVNFGSGNSQHPSGGIAAGERLIKKTYEAIRNSPHWESSMLIITYDEHGGFYDHVTPPSAAPTGRKGSKHGFMFDQLGPRVPAVVVSPRIPKGTIEHRLLEHCSIIKTACELFGVPLLTNGRDLNTVCGLLQLVTLPVPRTDTPTTLDDVVVSPIPRAVPLAVGAPDAPVWGTDDTMAASTLRAAAIRYAALEPSQKKEILERAAQVQTRTEAVAFLKDAHAKIEASGPQ